MQRFGRQLASVLQPGDCVGLDGPLGAGKTCLVQGLARGLGVPRELPIGSPTFTLVNQYPGRLAGRGAAPLTLFHVDLYRLASASELAELGLEEAAETGGVLAVEWLSRFPQALPADHLALTLAMLPTGGRSLEVHAGGPRSAARLATLQPVLQKWQKWQKWQKLAEAHEAGASGAGQASTRHAAAVAKRRGS
jgi:tRNA threonylcarbamoyladenosine biosynthesis protein TsaE